MRIDLPNSNEFKNILCDLTKETIDYKINGISTDSRNIKENDLYIATISSLCGGSIKSFEIKEHLKYDSGFVNLTTLENAKNLLISFKDFNGNQVRLDEGWALQSKTNNYYIDEARSITYTNTLSNKKITKVLTFYPDRFLIDIDIDITSLANNTLANNYTLTCVGGIPPTEKDSVTESTYFYSYLYS